MCDNLTYRSAGAETLVRMDTINILLRWSKEGVLGYVGTAFVQLNSPDEPISYIRTHVKLREAEDLPLSEAAERLGLPETELGSEVSE